MATYVTLAKWTEQGIRNVKDAPKRVEAFEKAVASAGGKLKDMYMLMGEYDLLVVSAADAQHDDALETTASQRATAENHPPD